LDYNTWWVLFGTSLLGAACGAVGVFLLLRRRALVADVISHATLPGIAVAFWLLWAVGRSGKSLPWLLLGAACSAGLGALGLLVLRNRTRLREDAAMGVVLTGWFAVGTVLLRWVQGLGGDAAGLEGFLFGKTATLVAEDGRWIALASLLSVGLVLLLKRPIGLICFDPAFSTSLGWSVWWLDFGLMMAAIALIIVGLQAVGAILMVALLVIPPAAARFWTTRLHRLLWIAMGLGGASGMVGRGSAIRETRSHRDQRLC
jgi:manganese/zinc/iron transport system permease protein